METYDDAEVDILRINWRDKSIAESDYISPSVILDYDTNGNAIGLEIFNTSGEINNFNSLICQAKNTGQLIKIPQ